METVSTHAANHNSMNVSPETQKSLEGVYQMSNQNIQSVFLSRLMYPKGGLPVLVISNDRKSEGSINKNQGQIPTLTAQQVIANEASGSDRQVRDVAGCDSELSTTEHSTSHKSDQNGEITDNSSPVNLSRLSYKVQKDFSDSTQAINTQEKLSAHIQTHPGETSCLKSFTTKETLKKHVEIQFHSGEYPFVCTHQNCGTQFTEYSCLKMHKLIHSEDELSPCDICREDASQNEHSNSLENTREARADKGHAMEGEHSEILLNKSHNEISLSKIQSEIQMDKEPSENQTPEAQIQINNGDSRIQVYTEQNGIHVSNEQGEISMNEGANDIKKNNCENREFQIISKGRGVIETDKRKAQDNNSALLQNMIVFGSSAQGLSTVNNSPCDLNSLSFQNHDGQQTIQMLHLGLSNSATNWGPTQTVSFPFMINSKTIDRTTVACEGKEIPRSKNKRNTEVLFLQSGSPQKEEFKNLGPLTTSRKENKKEKLYICEVEGCGRSFSSVGYLRYHQAVHEGKKSLQCPIYGCDRTFSWPAHLKYHQMTHSGERNFKCTYGDCDMTFMTPQRLAVHIRVHTGEKPFVCGETGCGKTFTTSGNLKNHSRIHSGERPFICTHPNCGRQFAEHSSLKKHKLVHTGEKPYLCEICGKTFSQSGSRKVHMRGHLEAQSSKKRKRSATTQFTSNQNVVVLGSNEILEYQDYQGSESVVFTQAIGEHVVTVTTQPADGESSQLDLNRGILGGEEVLTSETCIQTDGMCGVNSTGANVVVLSQPHDMVTMGSDFTSGTRDVAGMDPMMETDDESESTVWVEND